MDDRKRTFDTPDGLAGVVEQKRLRPEDILGTQDDRKSITRLWVNRLEFSKVIGKGGQTITNIRSTCGAQVKGSDIDTENRLVVISGNFRQVLEAFEMVTELMHASYIQTIPSEHFSVQILLEHAKAGRVVGQKGAMIQSLKVKSGAAQIRMQKDPKELCGILLRTLTIEGTLAAVRRAHYHVLELFADPSQLALVAAAINPAMTVQTFDGGFHQQHAASPQQPQQQQLNYPNLGGSVFAYGSSAGSGANGSILTTAIPISYLTNMGVPTETLTQIAEIKNFLNRQFGLDLAILPAGAAESAAAGTLAGLSLSHAERRMSNPDEVTFTIPKQSVGVIIGKGGQALKDLQAEFGVRVYVEREEVAGSRLVVLKPLTNEPAGDQERDAMQRCQDRILDVVAEEQQQAGVQTHEHNGTVGVVANGN